jgi:hypothetical protein
VPFDVAGRAAPLVRRVLGNLSLARLASLSRFGLQLRLLALDRVALGLRELAALRVVEEPLMLLADLPVAEPADRIAAGLQLVEAVRLARLVAGRIEADEARCVSGWMPPRG